MTDSIIFARAQPSTIRLTEHYAYGVEISANPHTEVQAVPTGRIEIMLPYDGLTYFSKQALEDLERQMPQVWEHEQVEARIGHIALTKDGFTDLDERYDLGLHYGVLPLDVPVQTPDLRGSNPLTDDRYACRIGFDYTLRSPQAIPLDLTARIFDEEAIGALYEEDGEKLVSLNIMTEAMRQAQFSRGLVFEFRLQLPLPGRVGRVQDDEPPILEHMALEWPVATSHSNVHLKVGGRDKPVIYNPERGVLEWSHIPFIPPREKTEGTDLYIYHTPLITLLVDQPGELDRREQLRGMARITIPRPFSGLRLAYFNARGGQSTVDLASQTTLSVDATLFVEDLFERKGFFPYHHLQFKDIVLDNARIHDVTTLLEERGFTILKQDDVGEHNGREHYFISATRQEGLGEMRLLLLIEGTYYSTTREKTLHGGEVHTRKEATGDLSIHLRGEFTHDSARLVGVMNEIQTLLRERFHQA